MITIRVDDVAPMTLTVQNARAVGTGPQDARAVKPDEAECYEAVTVAPVHGAEVRYTRFGRGAAIIDIDKGVISKASARAKGSAETSELPPFGEDSQSVRLVLDPHDVKCPAPTTTRLPISGTVSALGDETEKSEGQANPRLVLLSGTVQTMVRATDWTEDEGWRGWLDMTIGWPLRELNITKRDELFTAGQTTIPPGSTIYGATEECHRSSGIAAPGTSNKPETLDQNLIKATKDRPPSARQVNPIAKLPKPSSKVDQVKWSGFADLDFQDIINPGFRVETATRASVLEVRLPATFHNVQDDRTQCLSLSLAERIAVDPGLRQIAVMVGMLFVLVDFASRVLPNQRRD